MKKSLAQRSRKRTALASGYNKLMDCESGALSSAMDVDVHASTSHMNIAMAMDVSEVGSSTSQMVCIDNIIAMCYSLHSHGTLNRF